MRHVSRSVLLFAVVCVVFVLFFGGVVASKSNPERKELSHPAINRGGGSFTRGFAVGLCCGLVYKAPNQHTSTAMEPEERNETIITEVEIVT